MPKDKTKTPTTMMMKKMKMKRNKKYKKDISHLKKALHILLRKALLLIEKPLLQLMKLSLAPSNLKLKLSRRMKNDKPNKLAFKTIKINFKYNPCYSLF